MNRIIALFVLSILSTTYISGQDTLKNHYKYSKIIPVPDLSFFDQVYTGLDILEQMDFRPLKGKSIAILTNNTAINRNQKHILDILKNIDEIKVSFLFAMENGIWSIDDKRAKMIGRDQVDPVHGAPIIDLFNTYLYPPHWVMEKIDIILIDFQITGSRYPTYMATMSKVFESASKFNIPVLVLDRPNPLRGDIMDGPIPRTEYQSFEAYHLFPIRHGLTIGEISLIINEMGWVKESSRVDLQIMPMSNWSRGMWYDETELPWRSPTPYNLNQNILLFYSGMDLFRGTNLNIGFGTESPYLIFGSPWLATKFFKEKLEMLNLPGVSFKEIEYRPMGSPYYDRVPKYNGMSCSGLKVSVVDRKLVKPIEIATSIMTLISQLHPREFRWESNGYIDKLFGSNQLRLFVAQRKPPDYLSPQYMHDEIEFSKFRETFLLYKN